MLNLRYEDGNQRGGSGLSEATESEGPRDMADQKRRRREGTDTEPASVKALRLEVEELKIAKLEAGDPPALVKALSDEVERLKLRDPKLETGCKTPQGEEKEVKLPTRAWAIIAGKLDQNDVCSFALVSKQLREAQVLASRKLVTRPWWKKKRGVFIVAYFTEDWCAYWSRKLNVHHTDPEVIQPVLYIAARYGYLEVFEKYWSQGPQEKLSKLWDMETCSWAAFHGHLEVLKWLRAKGCPWGASTRNWAARGGQLEVLQWMRDQDPPCPWDWQVCYHAASAGNLEVLRWARSQGCPWDGRVPRAAARNGHLEVLRYARSQGCPWDKKVPRAAAGNGHLEVLRWLVKEGCPYDKRQCREAAHKGGKRARKVLEEKWTVEVFAKQGSTSDRREETCKEPAGHPS